MSRHSMFPLTGSAQIISSVFRCLLFMEKMLSVMTGDRLTAPANFSPTAAKPPFFVPRDGLGD
jgi:hypothetical protein